MLTHMLYRLACFGVVTSAYEFRNGPGSRLQNGGHGTDYQPILDLSETLIAHELGENSTALKPFARIVSPTNGTSTSEPKDIFKRQDNRPVGALKCSATEPCIDDSCCGAGGTCGFKEQNCGAGCQSKCEAKVMCGIDSKGGIESCGLQLCCSFYGWCGTKDVHCDDPEPLIGKTPCQEDFGGCDIIPSPECSSVDTGKQFRRIAYYAGWNTRDRSCDKVYPANINTTGLTHLMFAFIGFDPTTFMVKDDPKDIELYSQFTALGSKTLQTWIAIGGWAFTDPGETAHAFSDMVSQRMNRLNFIVSLMVFMEKYGFTGADIDWEYPSNPDRGGRKEDKENLVLLMKEMQLEFMSRGFGLSVVIAPDYWYLQGFAPAAMEPYVDHIGFMAYDLHGPWDSENALGNLMRPHTDIRDIDNGLTPLWFDGVNPSKVVMGIAYYGRTLTAKSADCPYMGCEFSGPGKAYGCTNAAGILSNIEIRRIINETGEQPFLLEGAMVKELIWDNDQWVAYDDWETIALKEEFARKRCLGGTMIWSIDYDSPSTGNGGTIPALPSTCGEDICWNVSGDKKVKCSDDGTNWDMGDRDDDIPDDILNIRKLAAIGDSYSAGIGAGDRLGSIYDAFEAGIDFACARYNKAYPYLLHQDSRIGDPSGRNFQFLSCSGAVMKDVLDNQIPKLDNNQDAITLSIGGNDVGLLSLLNSCIFQMGVMDKAQAEAAKLIAEVDKDYAWAKDFDWDSIGRGCEGQIQWSNSLATSQTFSNNLDDVLTAAKSKLANGAKIYVTGYAKFFGEALTTECDKVTWTTWIYKLINLSQPAAYLTRIRRLSMNLLVDTVNSQIEAAVERAGDSVRFISYDLYVGKYGGRYCEPGVDEATKESNTRQGLMFYELNSWDPAGTSPWKRDTACELSGTFYGDMLILAQITLLADPDAELHHDNGNKRLASMKEVTAVKERADLIDYLVPFGYARVFHPQIPLHKMIASLVVYEIMMDHQIRIGYTAWTEREDKVCQPTEGGTEPEAAKWQILIYEKVEECKRESDTLWRMIWGTELETCYTFGDDMPGTGCDQYHGDGDREDCGGVGLEPRSIHVTNRATCSFYYGAQCSSSFTAFVTDECVSGQNWPGDGAQVKSFKCYEK